MEPVSAHARSALLRDAGLISSDCKWHLTIQGFKMKNILRVDSIHEVFNPLYYFFKLLGVSYNITGKIILHINWAIVTFIHLIFITVSCHLTVEEVEKAPCIIRKIILELEYEKSLANELSALSSQLKDLKVNFTACGFISLDLQLLSAVMSIITTYIIILMQLN
ncbi:hypothetical protein ANN_18191 [Periplaneta americana]|uniref:Gustatory receptor n=1 Tax=Periplaneta americana TaxID=6978 RepID=A0ABQ8SPB7_PERAM|nr:hypothetical protein ANN_18191 [Periplaneta americana]